MEFLPVKCKFGLPQQLGVDPVWGACGRVKEERYRWRRSVHHDTLTVALLWDLIADCHQCWLEVTFFTKNLGCSIESLRI